MKKEKSRWGTLYGFETNDIFVLPCCGRGKRGGEPFIDLQKLQIRTGSFISIKTKQSFNVFFLYKRLVNVSSINDNLRPQLRHPFFYLLLEKCIFSRCIFLFEKYLRLQGAFQKVLFRDTTRKLVSEKKLPLTWVIKPKIEFHFGKSITLIFNLLRVRKY